MIPLIALMIGAYIVTQMMIFLLRNDPQQSKTGMVFNKILAALTIFITVICVISIYISSIIPSETRAIEHISESNKLPLSGKEVEASRKTEVEQAYINKVEIRNLRVAKTISGDFGVFGEIKNFGDRILRKVEITIYFLDKNDKPIFEKSYNPVFVTKFSIGDNEPLKPNYSTKFGYGPDDVPSDWAQNVRAKITNIEFE
jgi:hypothetical protein